jgi:hypothetical protein
VNDDMFPTFRLVASGRKFGMTVKDRKDGCRLITCDEMPGFSYVLRGNENPEVMLPTLETFLDVNSEWLAVAMTAYDQPELRAENERLREALERVRQWTEAYPLDIFPEPDWRKAKQLLEAGGMTLDSISAGAMRRVVDGLGKIIREALVEHE